MCELRHESCASDLTRYGHNVVDISRSDESSENKEPRTVPLRTFAVSLSATAVIALALGALSTFAIDRPHAWGIGAWVSDFAKSPGMAGIFALAAAIIAFSGIRLQARHTKAAMDDQRLAAENRDWWTRFEWAAERAVPATDAGKALAWGAVVSTFDALDESARDGVQKTAIGAIVEVAGERERLAREATPGSAETSAITTNERMAMASYVARTANTPAESAAVRAMLYESEVYDALQRIAQSRQGDQQRGPSSWQILRPLGGADAVIAANGRRVVIEMKAYSKPPSPRIVPKVLAQVAMWADATDSNSAVVVAPVAFPISQEQLDLSVESVVWAGPKDDEALRMTLERALDQYLGQDHREDLPPASSSDN